MSDVVSQSDTGEGLDSLYRARFCGETRVPFLRGGTVCKLYSKVLLLKYDLNESVLGQIFVQHLFEKK